MKKIKKLLFAIIMVALVMPVLLTGCKDDKSIKIWQEDGISQVKRGQELVIDMDLKKIELSSIEFFVDGSAIITNEGKLTVNTNATVGSQIKVTAKSEKDNVTSNELVFVVVDLVPTSISLVTDAQVLTKNSSISLSVNTTPDYATVKDVTYTIDRTDIAEIVDGKLKIKQTADIENLDDQTPINITATLNGHTNITAIKQVKYIVAQQISTIMANASVIDIKHASSPKLDFSVYNTDDIELSVEKTSFTYESSDPSVATIGSDGSIIPHKHGKSKITIKYVDDPLVKTECSVYVVATPNEIQFDLNKTNSHILDKKELYYSKHDTNLLKLDLIGTDFNGVHTSQKFKYRFSNATNDESNTIATVNNDKINFLKTGDITITVTSDSSIEGLDELPSTVNEKSYNIVVHVNEGINVRTVSELKAVSTSTLNNSDITTTINILNNINLTDTNNFGKVDEKKNDIRWAGLQFHGNTHINGNGYMLDASALTCEEVTDSGAQEFKNGANLFEFYRPDYAPVTVSIRDFNLKGALNVNKELKGFYYRALYIHGQFYSSIASGTYDENKTYGYLNLTVDNVTVDGFGVGMRISHAVDSLIKNTRIQNCFSNGIESDQNILTLQDITLGQVGAFGIEVTPDDLKDKESVFPHGTAGIHYNETPKLEFKGEIISNNYNNGASTEYIKTLSVGKLTFVNILDAIIQGNIKHIAGSDTSNDARRLLNVSYQVMRQHDKEYVKQITNDTDMDAYFQDKAVSLYLLIFVNKSEGMIYDGGNTGASNPLNPTPIYNEGLFLDFPEDTSNIINLTYLLQMVKTNPSYDAYKQYQYIQLDLDTGAGMMGNIGQVILLNQAYDPNYTTQSA